MITSLRLQNFRSYADQSFEFEPGVNIVVGPNASGKTNLLEAVLVLARGSSYKAKDAELVKHKKPWARADGNFGGHERSVKLKLAGGLADKSFLIDDKPFKRMNLERSLPVVFFEPNHLLMISRGPDGRRDWLDELLERTQPGFKQLANNYHRTLAQRNALLKKGSAYSQNQLFAWNVRLGDLGSQIATTRAELITHINTRVSKVYGQIAGKRTRINIEYQNQFPLDSYASKMVSKLEKSAALDFERGFTASGPHREDIAFYLNNQRLNTTASRGESRSLLLTLKILELDLVEKSRGQQPIFLLDDVFSELDSGRRRALVEYLKDRQTILTTTDADAVLEYFSGHHNLIPITKN